MEKISHSLPFKANSLEPYISEEIVYFHFEKHHQGYVNRYNQALEGFKDLHDLNFEDVLAKLSKEIREGNLSRIKLFQDGSQAWNHNFFWHSISLEKVTIDSDLIKSNFGDMDHFKSSFISLGKSHFGSGWIWVVKKDNELDFCLTHDADSPEFNTQDILTERLKINSRETKPILVCDLWEHSYYLQYKNDRESYLKSFVENLLDWSKLM